MTDRMDLETRQRVTAAGGHGRAAALTPTQRTDSARVAGQASQTLPALARRIVKAWPMLSRSERAEIRAILAAIMPRSR